MYFQLKYFILNIQIHFLQAFLKIILNLFFLTFFQYQFHHLKKILIIIFFLLTNNKIP